jgi:ribosomal protein S18 acetylase RimI-like enzyme
MPFESKHEGFVISTDPARLDIDAIHSYLSRSYWAAGIPKEVVAKSIEGSLCFGLYEGVRQVGLARVITDKATFAYLCDVYVLEEYCGRGLGKWLMRVVQSHPDLQRLRRFVLITRDAHGLYEQFGFSRLKEPDRYMEIKNAPYSLPTG